MLKSERQLLCHVYWSVRKHFLLQKASVSDMQKLLKLCVHIWLPMTSILFLLERQFNATNWDAIISRAKNFFSVFFCNFRNKFKFLTFSRKGWPSWLIISEITDSEKQVRSMSNKSHFRGPFQKQHSKRA